MRPPGGLARPRPRVEATVGAAMLVLVAALAGLVDPSKPGTYPACPFRAATGLACPGCGSLRAMHDLAHGDLVAALDHNALLIVVLAFSAVVWVRTLAGRSTPPRRWAGPAAAGLLVLWTFARNLTWMPFSVLAP